MEPSTRIFWLPKNGNTAEEYEDAFAHSQCNFSIADGATESSFAERWAQELVKKYVAAPPAGATPSSVQLENWLSPLQKEWHAGIAWDRLPWYAEEKARTGAFAAFLGLQFFESAACPEKRSLFSFWKKPATRKESKWLALAVGDSNLFHLRQSTLLRAFPIERAEQFDTRPLLLSSNPKKNNPVWQRIQMTEGTCQPGDVFLLMTDALANWFLKKTELNANPLPTILNITNEAEFSQFIEEQRLSTALKNDDVTLMVLVWKDSNK
ncbi:MAG: hypothetical protein JWN25_3403 [Verrucomicrobiales bacterium]|nr:hypothetical protein [Verrucomicrobiales bacterium]MDB6130138.1 hypothetical protein [Verrucomicrobiales bacterium]